MSLLEPFFYILKMIVDTYMMIVTIQIVLFWLIHFKIIKTSTAITKQVVIFLNVVTYPVYDKLSKKIRTKFGGFDFSPFILMLGLIFVSRLLYRIMILLVV